VHDAKYNKPQGIPPSRTDDGGWYLSDVVWRRRLPFIVLGGSLGEWFRDG
jgi:hypothetical protein